MVMHGQAHCSFRETWMTKPSFDLAGKAISASPLVFSPVEGIETSQQHHDLRKPQHVVEHPQPTPVLQVEGPSKANLNGVRSSSSVQSRVLRLQSLSCAAIHPSGGSKGKSVSSGHASRVHTTLDGPSLTLSANQLITKARHNVTDSKRLYTECVQGWKGHSSIGAHLGSSKPRGRRGLVACCVPEGHKGPCSTQLKVGH